MGSCVNKPEMEGRIGTERHATYPYSGAPDTVKKCSNNPVTTFNNTLKTYYIN